VLGARAHAFTDSPREFLGLLKEVVNFPLTSNKDRSIFIATLNAVLKYLNFIENTIHCKDEDPEKCGREIASQIMRRWGKINVGLIGLNPAIADNLVGTFGIENVKITDLDRQNVNSFKYGVKVWYGNEMTEELIKQSDVILITGTTLVNGTFDPIMNCIQSYKKDYMIYGVTGAGICNLMRLNRICPYSKSE
ncbi:MAG: Rossmann-like domain-containing protein, partial [Thermodesulfobacteriota bacterium]